MQVQYLNFQALIKKISLLSDDDEKKLMSRIFEFIKSIQSMAITETEMALLSALILISAGRYRVNSFLQYKRDGGTVVFCSYKDLFVRVIGILHCVGFCVLHLLGEIRQLWHMGWNYIRIHISY